MADLRINDGGGLYDSDGMIDSLIVDCNSAVVALTGNNGVRWCAIMVEMVSKLSALKDGVRKERESLQKQIDDFTKGGG